MSFILEKKQCLIAGDGNLPVIMVKNGESRYVVKPQTYEDVIRNDV